MHPDRLKSLLQSVACGEVAVENALDSLKHLTVEDIGYAHIDHHRSLRKGFPEVIYGENKTAVQITGIMEKMIPRENIILVTRIDEKKARQVQAALPDAAYHVDARMLEWAGGDIPITGKRDHSGDFRRHIGHSVAREAFLTARAMGNPVKSIFDVGVAGIHRLFSYKDDIESAAVLIVVAGMEGALPSVVAGLVDKPVIGVPTSVGYGASLGGLAALFSMLNSCSSNVAVVNIDNGFGAAYMASMINRL
jgi:pyridinium-3,5-biscarboxylic acid mononucleotide synthase